MISSISARGSIFTTLVACVCLLVCAIHAEAAYQSDWTLAMYADHFLCRIGASTSASDGFNGYPGGLPPPDWSGVAAGFYRLNGPDWAAPSTFYYWLLKSPIPPDGMKTWDAGYLWTQNYTSVSQNRVQLLLTDEPAYRAAGYRAHLVLDYVPAAANWAGQLDYWLDLSVSNTLTLPAVNTSDPLADGTRFHIDVYAPVPEPSSLAALICGLAGVGGAAIRRRRK